MKRMIGGQPTPRGMYLSLRTGEVITVPRRGGMLPGEPTITYVKLPAPMAAALGPVAGLTYVIFLPLIGIAMAAWYGSRQAIRGMKALGHRAAELATAEWQHGVSFFARRRHARTQRKQAETEEL
ncbi:MAG: hypothetical protein HYX87_02670 [Chloroflexi bacterium]|nr:hypothetical protein [Chloroflexota bacterium]